MSLRIVTLGASAALLAACGGSSSNSTSGSGGPPGYYLSITGTGTGASFSPVSAPSGATVTLVNADKVAHEIVGEAAAGDFTPGSPAGVAFPFDTGPFTGVKTLLLPAGLANGTVLPYYCSIHKTAEVTPNGAITIQNAAPPQPPPGGGGGGY